MTPEQEAALRDYAAMVVQRTMERDAALHNLESMIATANEVAGQRDAARADAERLAEALDHARAVIMMMQTGYRLDARDAAALVAREDEATAVLAAHEAER